MSPAKASRGLSSDGELKKKRQKAVATKSKPSNRPRYSASPSPEGLSADDEEAEHAARLAALEQLQAAFVAEALPAASSSHIANRNKSGVFTQQKSVWEMDMNDFDEDGESEKDGEESEESEDSRDGLSIASKSGPIVVAFREPRSGGPVAGGSRDMRDFMSAKVKNLRPTFSVADLVNAKHVKGKAKAADSLDAEEEARLASLDADLSSLIRPLTSSSGTTHSQLPTLLASLPTAPTKPLKGLTPLPGNAPRTLRRGQNAANLKRARARDESAGVLAGAKRGREALSLKEKRKEEGGDKRQRGLSGTVGKMTRGGLMLSKEEIARGNGVSPVGRAGSGRGGGKGGRGGKRGGKAGRK